MGSRKQENRGVEEGPWLFLGQIAHHNHSAWHVTGSIIFAK